MDCRDSTHWFSLVAPSWALSSSLRTSRSILSCRWHVSACWILRSLRYRDSNRDVFSMPTSIASRILSFIRFPYRAAGCPPCHFAHSICNPFTVVFTLSRSSRTESRLVCESFPIDFILSIMNSWPASSLVICFASLVSHPINPPAHVSMPKMIETAFCSTKSASM